MAILENPLSAASENYLQNGNRLLLDLLGVNVISAQPGIDLSLQLGEQTERLQAQGFRPYMIPVGGSTPLGSIGYVECVQEIVHQSEQVDDYAAVVVASGSGGTHAGLALGFEHYLPATQVIGVTVSRSQAEQYPVVDGLRQQLAQRLQLTANQPLTLWDDFFAPG